MFQNLTVILFNERPNSRNNVYDLTLATVFTILLWLTTAHYVLALKESKRLLLSNWIDFQRVHFAGNTSALSICFENRQTARINVLVLLIATKADRGFV